MQIHRFVKLFNTGIYMPQHLILTTYTLSLRSETLVLTPSKTRKALTLNLKSPNLICACQGYTPLPAELSAPKGKVSNCAGLSWVHDLRLRGAFQGFVVLRVRGVIQGFSILGPLNCEAMCTWVCGSG